MQFENCRLANNALGKAVLAEIRKQIHCFLHPYALKMTFSGRINYYVRHPSSLLPCYITTDDFLTFWVDLFCASADKPVIIPMISLISRFDPAIQPLSQTQVLLQLSSFHLLIYRLQLP